MSRKTDAELLAELKKQNQDRDDAEEEEKEADNKKYSAEAYVDGADTDDESDKKPISKKQPPVQIVEREINLQLINDKLNFIISKVQNIK